MNDAVGLGRKEANSGVDCGANIIQEKVSQFWSVDVAPTPADPKRPQIKPGMTNCYGLISSLQN